MKKGIIAGLFLILVATSASAVEVLWSSITNYTSTKANKTIPITQVEPMIITTSASTCTAYIDNTTGDGVAIPANTLVTIRTPSNVSNIVFACQSSAGTTISRIK